jgi:hypothetical protein
MSALGHKRTSKAWTFGVTNDGGSSLNRMNVAAVLALKKMHRRSGCGTFAGVLKFQFAATSRTRLVTDVFGFHCHPQGWVDVRSPG